MDCFPIIFAKANDPATTQVDVMQHFYYYFKQLAGLSAFPAKDMQQSERAMVLFMQHRAWNYNQNVGLLMLQFDPQIFNPTPDQQQQCAYTFEVFLNTLSDDNRARFLTDHLDILKRAGATSIPSVMAQVLSNAVGEQSAVRIARKI